MSEGHENMTELSIRQQMPIMQRICDMFGVIIKITDDIPVGVHAQTDCNQTIEISNEPRTRDSLVSTIMHEVCHILAAKQGIYKVYHKTDNLFTRRELYTYRRTAVNAEVYVDTWAERLTKMYFPNVIYERSYRTPESRQWKKEKVNKWTDDFLKCFDVISEIEEQVG